MNQPRPNKRLTRQHKAGNSFSVRLPRDMAYPDPEQELEIEAVGDERIIRPKARPSIIEMLAETERLHALGAQGPSDNALIRPEGRPSPWER